MVNTELRAYRERWQAVEEMELQESRDASIQVRWQQLNSLVRLAAGLGLRMECDEEPVRERWLRLKARA